MKNIILGALGGFILGGIAGYFGGQCIMKNKYDKALTKEVQEIVTELKNKEVKKDDRKVITQKELALMNEQEKKRIVHEIPHFNGQDIIKSLLNDKYKTSNKDDDLPFELSKDNKKEEEEKLEHHNIWDDNVDDIDENEAVDEDDLPEPIDDSDIAHLDYSKPPFPIDKDKYSNDFVELVEEGIWSKVSLILFTDNVIAEEKSKNDFVTMTSEEANAAIGVNNLKDFINDKSIGRIFIRNNRLHIDFEIVRSPRSYSSALAREEE